MGLYELYSKRASKMLAGRAGVFVVRHGMCYEFYGSRNSNVAPYVRIDGKKYYKKEFGEYSCSKFLNDMFASFLAKKMALNSVGYKLLVDDIYGIVGKISKDFGKHKSLEHIFGGSSMEDNITAGQFVDRIQKRYPQEQGYYIDRDQLSKDLCKLCCFDFLTNQTDRFGRNIAIFTKNINDKKIVVLAPIYDNEFTFNPDFDFREQFYKLNPIEGEYGFAHREFMQTEPWAIKFFEKFKSLVEGDNFVKTLREFESVYGLEKLYGLAKARKSYVKQIETIKRSIDDRLAFMHQNAEERE